MAEDKTITQKLINVQSALKAPKGQFNSFGKYKYRSCEDILEAVKPLLKTNGLALVIRDEIVEIAGRVYVKATAQVMDENGAIISTTALAREPDMRKGMDESQVTGSSSSYARKYALNGLFAIDDNKDADSNELAKAEQEEAKPKKTASKKQPIQELPDDYCTICHLPVMAYDAKDKDGNIVAHYPKNVILEKSIATFGSPICMSCWMKKKAVEKMKKQEAKLDGEYQALLHEDAGDRV